MVAPIGPAHGPLYTAVAALVLEHGLCLRPVPPEADIPGSYWGEPEAGLIRDTLYVREDTPVHSVLHESCHYLCMDPGRRRTLHTNAGGDALEECAVCYLSILLSDRLPGFSRERMLADMDEWGYSFRLGSARAWFECDAEDARSWLLRAGLLPGRARQGAAARNSCADRPP